MKDLPQNQDPEQLNNGSAPAGQSEKDADFSLDEIMNEFGGWSDREARTAETPPPAAAAPPQPDAPAEPAVPAAPEKPKPETADKPDNVIPFVPRQSVPKADMMADTLRFAPVEPAPAPPEEPAPKIWTYKAEPEPTDQTDRRAAGRARKAAAQEKRRLARLERYEKKQQKLRSKREKKRTRERPEVEYASPQAAYEAYSRHTSLQLRLFLSALLTAASVAMLALVRYTVGGLSFSGQERMVSIVMLAAMLVQALLDFDVFVNAVARSLRLKFDHTGLLLLLVLAAAADAFFAIQARRIPFCTAVSVELTVALWGEYLELSGKRKTLRAVCAMDEPTAAVREEKAWHGKDCIFRAPGDTAAFTQAVELPDIARRAMRVYAPCMAALTLAVSFLTSSQSKENFLWAWTAMLLAGYPMGALISFARPFAIQAKRLYRCGAAVAGWQGARALGGECGLAIEDADLFPKSNVTLNGMKIYSDRSVSQIIGYGTAVVETAGSGLVPLFREIMKNQNGRHYTVDTFRRYEGGGLGAEIRGDVILMGSLAFMKLMKVRMPEGTKVKQAVYLSINGDLAGVFALNYAPASATRSSLLAAIRAKGLIPILATRDFMITPQFLKHRYKVSTDRVEFPTVEERAQLSAPEAVKDGVQGALMARGSFNCYVTAVVGARALRGAALGSLAAAIAGGLLGAAVLFFLTFIGSVEAVSAWNLLLYGLLWLLPGLLITGLVGRG